MLVFPGEAEARYLQVCWGSCRSHPGAWWWREHRHCVAVQVDTGRDLPWLEAGRHM